MDDGHDRIRCDVAIVGAGLSGLYAARILTAAGFDVRVVEARDRVGGRTLTRSFTDGTFFDDGGQWVSPGQNEVVALARELGVELFPSWSDGLTVHWRSGQRHLAPGLFLDDEDEVTAAVQGAARELFSMALSVDPERPWEARASWDDLSLHQWLADNVSLPQARRILATAIEGVFASNTLRTSLLAALYWVRCGDPLTPFVTTDDLGPEQRFAGGAQQLCSRMADELPGKIHLDVPVEEITQTDSSVILGAAGCQFAAQESIVSVPPALAQRIRYVPRLPALRDQLMQRAPMRWVVKVHCLYPRRFWTEEGLSGAVISDSGLVRVCADNSPPSGAPGVLVSFIEEAQMARQAMTEAERQKAVLRDLARYFGEAAGHPLEYAEMHWGDEEFSRGVDGGYWGQGVWTTYGRAVREPVGRIHWAGTETSAMWNGKLEGALLAGRRAAQEVMGMLT